MSWKQYGGIRKNDKLNNLAIGTLVADDIILRQVKVTTHIFEDTIVAKKDIQFAEGSDLQHKNWVLFGCCLGCFGLFWVVLDSE